MWLKIDDPDKSWELLHAGLLWFKRDNGEYEHYNADRAYSWGTCRHLWATPDGENFPKDKYIQLED